MTEDEPAAGPVELLDGEDVDADGADAPDDTDLPADEVAAVLASRADPANADGDGQGG
jgi:hypothetical protein